MMEDLEEKFNEIDNMNNKDIPIFSCSQKKKMCNDVLSLTPGQLHLLFDKVYINEYTSNDNGVHFNLKDLNKSNIYKISFFINTCITINKEKENQTREKIKDERRQNKIKNCIIDNDSESSSLSNYEESILKRNSYLINQKKFKQRNQQKYQDTLREISRQKVNNNPVISN